MAGSALPGQCPDDQDGKTTEKDNMFDYDSFMACLDHLDDHISTAEEKDASKYFTGTHEVLECLEGQGEADLHTHLASCKKNPGHIGFIPVKNLALEHFPPGYHDNDLYDLTKALADLTVRIAVTFTSPDRPEFVPGTRCPYPCYNSRGTTKMRTGTGTVWSVIKYTEGIDNYVTCPCPECDNTNMYRTVWWEVRVVSATHVVFNESEASCAKFRLFFDDKQSPMVQIHWRKGVVTDTEGDWCSLFCVTHDVELGNALEEMKQRFDCLCKKVMDKYKSRRNVDKLTIIASHPHGCSKQVSIGHWVDREVVAGLTRYTYTTCTCPGCSGALVYRLGYGWLSAHPHSGAHVNGLNYSGLWID